MSGGEDQLLVSRYRLRRELGHGGMGTVWLAHDEQLHRDVAIKQVTPRGRTAALDKDDPYVRRALREARAAAKLADHPGIVTVYDVVTDSCGQPWIVMQLLDGRSLGDVLDVDGPLPVTEAARIGAQMVAALSYAHETDVLHRDIKPGNVMLVGEQVVLTDFGLAQFAGGRESMEGWLVGTPEYMAPERVTGHSATPASDLWAVGVVLYEMVTGRSPFYRDDYRATCNAVLTQPPTEADLGSLAPVIDGLLEKNPVQRMPAAEAGGRLAAVAAGLEVPAGRKNRRGLLLGVGSVVLLVAAVLVAVLLGRPPERLDVAGDTPRQSAGGASATVARGKPTESGRSGRSGQADATTDPEARGSEGRPVPSEPGDPAGGDPDKKSTSTAPGDSEDSQPPAVADPRVLITKDSATNLRVGLSGFPAGEEFTARIHGGGALQDSKASGSTDANGDARFSKLVIDGSDRKFWVEVTCDGVTTTSNTLSW